MKRTSSPHTKLGQHFLTRTDTAAKIADAANLTPNETVLEIGPGHGILTRELLARAGKVLAIEKDPGLFTELQNTFASELAHGNLKLVQQDVRSFNPYTLLRPSDTGGFGRTTPYNLIANIPYYITSAIIRQFLTAEHQPETMVLLIQKEVAERIVARNSKHSLLSLSVQAYGTPRIAYIVKAGAFNPPPKVDSAVLVIEEISRAHFHSSAHEERFFTLLHAAFAGKRKQLGTTLKSLVSQEALGAVGIEKAARPEDVQLEQWLALAAQ